MLPSRCCNRQLVSVLDTAAWTSQSRQRELGTALPCTHDLLDAGLTKRRLDRHERTESRGKKPPSNQTCGWHGKQRRATGRLVMTGEAVQRNNLWSRSEQC